MEVMFLYLVIVNKRKKYVFVMCFIFKCVHLFLSVFIYGVPFILENKEYYHIVYDATVIITLIIISELGALLIWCWWVLLNGKNSMWV